MGTRVATCACGGLSAACTGEPLSVSLCHCRQCQKRTGSAFGVAAFFRREDVEIGGASTSFTRSSDSGSKITLHFCPACGSTVFWYPERKPEAIAVGIGSFADTAFPAPSKEVHTEHRQPWVTLAL